MSENLCVVCGRPTPDGYACAAEAAESAQKLRSIVELAPEARRVAYGLTRGAEGAASGKPGSRSPGNDDAMDALSEITSTVVGLACDIADTRGVHNVSAVLRSPGVADPLTKAAKWLTGQTEWLRHAIDAKGEPYALSAYDDIAQAAGKLRWIVDGPGAKKYLGPCGAPMQIETTCFDQAEPTYTDGPRCEGDVYGPAGGKRGRCRTCGAEVDQGERRAWLDEQVRDKAFRAAHIADAYGINVKTIRSWAERGHLVQRGIDRGLRPVYLVGDVLDLARQAADRRAENQTKRAAREAAEMGA